MPRPTLPDCYSRVRTMNVLLTKHTAEEVWNHLVSGFDVFEEKADGYINKLEDTIAKFKETRPYDKIDWRRHYHSGSATKHRISTYSWNEYEDEDYDRLWDYGRDLHALKEEFGKKEEYERFCRIAKNFQDTMRPLIKEYERIEKQEWEMSYENWKIYDAEWIKHQEFVKSHRHHKSVEEQTKSRDAYIKQYPAEREMLLGGRWEIVDYTLTCSLCKDAVEENKRRDQVCKEREEALAKANQEYREQKEAERREQEEEKRRAYAELPVLVCDACKYSTKSEGAYEQHNESKEHKQKVRDQSLYCEKCDHRSRYRAEHEFHLHSKAHIEGVKEKIVLYCEKCDHHSPCRAYHEAHLHSKKHLGEVKEKPTLYCEICEYTAKNKGNYDYHMKSNKHLKKVAVV